MTALLSALLAAAVAQPLDAAPQPTVSRPEPTSDASLAHAVMPRALASVLADDEDPLGWKGNVGIGVNFTEGNSRTLTGNASADAQYTREKDRFTLKFLWTYKSDKDTSPSVVDRKTFLSGQYDYFLNEKTYAFGRLQFQSDLAAALDLRTTVAGGLGHQFANTEEWRFRGEGGLSYVDEDYVGTANDDDYIAAALSYSAGYTPNDTWDFAQDAFWYPSLEDIHDMVARVDTRAKYLMSENIFAQLQWIWDWTRTPLPGAGPSDHTVLLTVGWAF